MAHIPTYEPTKEEYLDSISKASADIRGELDTIQTLIANADLSRDDAKRIYEYLYEIENFCCDVRWILNDPETVFRRPEQ